MFSEDLWSWCGLFESLRRTRVFRDPQDPLSSSDEFLKDLDSPQRMNLCQLLEPNRTNLTRKVLPVPQTASASLVSCSLWLMDRNSIYFLHINNKVFPWVVIVLYGFLLIFFYYIRLVFKSHYTCVHWYQYTVEIESVFWYIIDMNNNIWKSVCFLLLCIWCFQRATIKYFINNLY